MAKPKDRRRVDELHQKMVEMAGRSRQANPPAAGETLLQPTATGRQAPRMKKFRFQLLHQWIVQHMPPGRVADIGGGKGLLAYLLQESGWDAVVIDPENQALGHKHKDVTSQKRVLIPPDARVPRLDAQFEPPMAEGFDLLIGLHAHGCNIKIIDAATTYNTGFLLLPCCVIDEPLWPMPGRSWHECLAAYAIEKGHIIAPLRLAFKGQNIGFYSLPSWEGSLYSHH